MSSFDNELIHYDLWQLAKQVRHAGFKKEANRILKLSDKSKQVVEILVDTFKNEFGPDLALERANNLAPAILYFDPNDRDFETDIHDLLLRVNESHYDADRKRKLTDQKAWQMASKAIKSLQHKKILPQDIN